MARRATKRRSDEATKGWCPRGQRPRGRRGIALLDAIVGGVMLGIGLSVMLSVIGHSASMQAKGEHIMTASWLADEILTMVLVDGPERYPRLYDTSGRFGPPFDRYAYEVDIEQLGRGLPYRVNAFVTWGPRPDEAVRVETLIALRAGDPEQPREPYERVDRDARYFDDEP